jgi:hypothetical protein
MIDNTAWIQMHQAKPNPERAVSKILPCFWLLSFRKSVTISVTIFYCGRRATPLNSRNPQISADFDCAWGVRI